MQAHALGRLTLARIRHGHFYGLRPEFRESWHVRKGEAGGGALLDEGVHAADLLAWLFGVPEHVVAHVSHAALGLEVEDVGVAVFSWSSGLVAEVSRASRSPPRIRRSSLRHRRQPARVRRGPSSRDITEAGLVRLYRTGTEPRRWETIDMVPRFKLGEFHQQNALAFVAALSRGLAPPITIDDRTGGGPHDRCCVPRGRIGPAGRHFI